MSNVIAVRLFWAIQIGIFSVVTVSRDILLHLSSSQILDQFCPFTTCRISQTPDPMTSYNKRPVSGRSKTRT